MKIFLTGSHGTGKSTIVELLAEQLPGYKIYNSLTSLFLKNKEDQLPSSPRFIEFQQRLYLYTLNIYVNEDNFISSRGVFDMNAYIHYALKQKELNKEQEKNLKILLKTSKAYKKYYLENAIYFYLPIEFPASENNPNRIMDEKYRKKIDKLIKKELINSGIDFILITGSIEKRLETIKSILKERGVL